MAGAHTESDVCLVKTTNPAGSKQSVPVLDPHEREPQYDDLESSDPALKQAVAQEERRSAQHGGKTIKRPERVMRTMSS
jgi:hypothetical protein